MFKKILMVLGTLVLLMIALIAFVYYDSIGTNNEARPFAEQILKDVGKSWDSETLKHYAHPDFMKVIPQGQSLDDFTKIYTKLGPIESTEPCKMTHVASTPTQIDTAYVCNIKTEKASAVVTISLRKDTDATWRLLSFKVHSDYFSKLLRSAN